MLRWLFAALHLIALGIGLGSIWARALALRGALNPEGLKRVFYADNIWAVAGFLWLTTGVARAFLGFEKGADYYLHNYFFLAKVGCFLAIVALEIRPIVALMRWRMRLARGEVIDTSPGPALARTSMVQAFLVLIMILLATAMARGYGFRA
ncbi:MAG: DUF2214 family protein [Gemmatimonadales bacterium]